MDLATLNSVLRTGIAGAAWTDLTTGLILLIIAVMIWKFIWYGLALYKSIQLKQKTWFVVLLVCVFLLGDVGLLAIIYLIIYRDKKGKRK